MSKKTRMEFSQAKNHESDRETFNAAVVQYKRKSSPRTPAEIAEMERIERAEQEKSASIAARDWPPCFADQLGAEFARLTNGVHGGAVAASKAFGFLGSRLYMRGFLSALGRAAYEREGGR